MKPGPSARLAVTFLLLLGSLLLIESFYRVSSIGKDIADNLWGLNLQHYSEFVAEIPRSERQPYDLGNDSHDESESATAATLSPPGGIFQGTVEVAASGAARDATLRYTRDGSVPTESDSTFSGPITVAETSVLRVKAFEDGRLPSLTTTAVYVMDYPGTVPVATLTLDPVYLFNARSGIYSNPFQRGRAWERPAEFSILSSTDHPDLAAEVRVRIHGDSSRANPLKSFRLYLPAEDGDMRHWFGDDADRVSISQSEWVLKHGNNFVLFRDRIGSAVAHELGLPTSPAVPMLLVLNGEPWGVYDLMERVNRAFIAGKDRVPADGNLLRGSLAEPVPVFGDKNAWEEFYRFIESADLTDEETYRRVAGLIDLENVLNYLILHVFIADNDGPDSNADVYRTGPDAPWRFLVWDLDAGFNYRGEFTEHNTLAWYLRDTVRPDLKPYGTPDAPWQVRSTVLFRKLMENSDFRERFHARFDQLLNSTFTTENLNVVFDEVLASYADVSDFDYLRYPDLSRDEARRQVDTAISRIRDFIERRPAIMRRHLDAYREQ